MTSDRAILIAGPTASGKSELALRLAAERNGSIINADSMQVYDELRTLTARPTPGDEARAPHLLYGHVPASEAYSAGRFAREAATAIAKVRAEGRTPIVVGGTGLYFRALLQGLSPIPAIPETIRSRWRAEAESLGAAQLHALLAERDPVMAARLRPSDPQRVTRALEVLEATGRSLAAWQNEPGAAIVDEHASDHYVLMPDRDELYRRCDQRFEAMLRNGALEEAARVGALHLSPDLPAMRALGLQPLLQHIAGRISLADAEAEAKQSTRNFAKRQLTWLRRNMKSWNSTQT